MPRRATSTSFGGVTGNKRGNGSHGRGGSKPETFRNRMALIASRAKTLQNLEAILNDPKNPAFMKALEFASDRGYGKADQNIKANVTLDVVIRDEAARE